VWGNAEKGRGAGLGDHPDFVPDKAPGYEPPEGATGMEALTGTVPFITHPDGLGWIWAPSGLVDGPLPTHYEPQESPVDNALYGVRASPTRQAFDRPENPYNPPGAEAYPFVLTTYRLTEHHTAGGMSRTLPYLSELQPEPFVEVSRELAAERGLEHAGWATIVTTRTAIEARVMVTDRLRPLTVRGRRVHQVGVPYHFGRRGLARGDSANELLSMVLDDNVHIAEYKVLTCDVLPGRRPRGAALTEFVEDYRRRSGVLREAQHEGG
jgi:formate dehydrogenase major subunit